MGCTSSAQCRDAPPRASQAWSSTTSSSTGSRSSAGVSKGAIACDVSAQRGAIVLASPPPVINIAVVGPPGVGCASVCTRFLEKRFPSCSNNTNAIVPEDEAAITSGTRIVSVNGSQLMVRLTKVDATCAEAAVMPQVANADAVLVVVDATQAAPFDSAAIFLDNLQLQRLSGATSTSACTASRSPLLTMQRFDVPVAASASATATATSGEGPPPHHLHMKGIGMSKTSISSASTAASCDSIAASPAIGFGTPLAGSGSCSTAFGHQQTQHKVWRSGLNLNVDTTRRSRRGRKAPHSSSTSTPVVCVLANNMDLLANDAVAAHRATVIASNWGKANRCRVALGSALTGAGVNEVVAEIIRQVYKRNPGRYMF